MTYIKNTKNKKLCEYNLAFVDCETTGLSPQDNEIIEIAAILYDPRKDKILQEWERKTVPRNIKTASKIALDMNGYNDAPETYLDSIQDVIPEFCNLIEGYIIVGQNIQFDIDFIEKYYEEFKIDKEIRRKIEISSMTWPILSKSDLLYRSLGSQCHYFGISNEGAHRALIDCRRALEVYRCAMKILG